ncbi:MAG: hypothetical protein ABIG66_02935 [Candidatus Kerfeldbacteria bacterium]
MPPDFVKDLLDVLAKVMGKATKRLVPDPEEGWRLVRDWVPDEALKMPTKLAQYTMLVCRTVVDGVVEILFYGDYAQSRCMPIITEWAQRHQVTVNTVLVRGCA